MNYINLLRNKKLLDRENFDNYFDNITNLKNQKVLICGYGDVGSKLSKFLSFWVWKFILFQDQNLHLIKIFH